MKFHCNCINTAKNHRYIVTIDDGESTITEEMYDWCCANFELDAFSCGIYSVFFSNEENRNWFILRFS